MSFNSIIKIKMGENIFLSYEDRKFYETQKTDRYLQLEAENKRLKQELKEAKLEAENREIQKEINMLRSGEKYTRKISDEDNLRYCPNLGLN